MIVVYRPLALEEANRCLDILLGETIAFPVPDFFLLRLLCLWGFLPADISHLACTA